MLSGPFFTRATFKLFWQNLTVFNWLSKEGLLRAVALVGRRAHAGAHASG